MFRHGMLLLALSAIALAPGLAWTEEKDDTTSQSQMELHARDLIGTYRVIEAENSGMKTPKEKLDGVMVKFTEDTIIAHDKDKKQMYSASFKLDTSKTPAVIVMTSNAEESKGTVVKGLIRKDGEVIHLIYTLPKDEGGGEAKSPPKVFKTEKGQVMTIMKKMAEKVAEKPDNPSVP